MDQDVQDALTRMRRLTDDEARRAAEAAAPVPNQPIGRLDLGDQQGSLRLIRAMVQKAAAGAPDGARIANPGEHWASLKPEGQATT